MARQPRAWHTAVPMGTPATAATEKPAYTAEMARAVCSGEETSFAYSIATAVRVPDTSAATTREAYSTATPGASMLRTFTPRNRSISPISRRKRSIRPVRAVSSGVPTA